ncbi:MAG: glycosyl hydrolase family 8 [Oenococcus sp.]|uniref:glycosyl hydrolase family 8 n=1 Tax=Oenococcus sp. TaxID=1979414 RepID=UPI0039EC4534
MGENKKVHRLKVFEMFVHILKRFWVLILVVIYLFLLMYVRISNDGTLGGDFYHHWKENYLCIRGNDAFAKTNSSSSADITSSSESQGYAMRIVLYAASKHLANQRDFERLLAYYQKNELKHTHLMSANQSYSRHKTIRSTDSNTSGDLLIADSLIQASKMWPHKASLYESLARALLRDILKYEYNQNDKILTLGNRAIKGTPFYKVMDTADVMPEEFDDFRTLTGQSAWFVVKRSMLRKLVSLSKSNKYGLIPDFAILVKHRTKAFKHFSHDYSYRACRIPMNLAYSTDSDSRYVLHRLLLFFNKQSYISAGYRLNGQKIHQYQSPSFSSPILLASGQFEKYLALYHRQEYVLMHRSIRNDYEGSTLTTIAALKRK